MKKLTLTIPLLLFLAACATAPEGGLSRDSQAPQPTPEEQLTKLHEEMHRAARGAY